MKRSITLTRRRWYRLALIISLTVLAGSALTPVAIASPTPNAGWPMFGQNLDNTASAPHTNIGTNNVSNLQPKWTFNTSGDVSARAAVVANVAYLPDWGGNLYALNAANGDLIWSKNILSDYFPGGMTNPFTQSPATEVVSRTSPFVDISAGTLYIGTQTGAYLLAIDIHDGSLKWKTQLDSHQFAIDTQSPIVYNGVVYVGVSSSEEGAPYYFPNYDCCSFRGSVVALNATNGTIKWKSYTVPDGYNGGSVWGSTIVPDPQLGVIFATTGNNYTAPTDPAYEGCISGGGTEENCLSLNDHFDSVLALNMSDGSIAWAHRLASADDWNAACFVPMSPCPANPGQDVDFGSGVNLFTIQTANGPKTIIGAGQKSGVYWAFDPASGQVLWATQVGPGSPLGGIEWGSATDGQRIYVAIANLYGIPTATGSAGLWAALDPISGQILWQTADPNGAMDLGAMAVANGVVYAPSIGTNNADWWSQQPAFSPDTTSTMFALDAATGNTLWSFASGGSVAAGAVVVNNTVYWGSGGYASLAPFGGVSNHKFYAFTVGGH